MKNTVNHVIPGGRSITITPGYLDTVPSAMICQGNTRLLCTASYEDKVPPFIKEQKDKKLGWLKAEYSMLPTAGGMRRQQRERNRPNSRSLEIERFIGRALRTVINLKTLGHKTITIDCDVLQADGGTRCAAIIGGMVALNELLRHMVFEQILPEIPRMSLIAAISVGVKDDQIMLDMDYKADLTADADINVVSDEDGKLIETTTFIEGKPLCPELHSEAVNRAIAANTNIITLLKSIFER